jgi:hypothetical protein
MVDAFTTATCFPNPNPDTANKLTAPAVTTPFSCAVQADKERCLAGGGVCEIQRDGYYMVNIMCVIIGVVTFTLFIRPKVLQLQALPLRAWRLSSSPPSKY